MERNARRSKAVGVSATPGFTKSMQEIHLDKTVSEKPVLKQENDRVSQAGCERLEGYTF